MKKYLLKVEVEPLEEGGYLAICPDLQGCHAEGDTIAEALENVEDMARIIIEFCMEEGLPLPPELEFVEEPPVLRAEVLVKVGD
ncbi:MAG: type II toxin-antitoxin system HicB family antitoxin [Dehalococcoidia bacterium]